MTLDANTHNFRLKLSASFYSKWIEPKSSDETLKRKELIFNILIVSALSLMLIVSIYGVVNVITQGASYGGASPLLFLLPLGVLIGLYSLSRRHFTTALGYVLVSIFLFLATFALWQYGYVLPEGLLTYAMVIVMAGILISVRAAWIMLAIITVALLVISYVQVNGITHPDISDVFNPLRASAILVYFIIFLVIIVVSWLYDSDIEASLKRAHISEAALKRERNSLEAKVRKRTKQLEQAQVENMLELHRFSEFGRLSATLLHELANPLTSVSLELEQLELKGYKEAVSRARQSVAHMEDYVVAARRQLTNQSEEKDFQVDEEIAKVVTFLMPKAQGAQVSLVVKSSQPVTLFGDSIRFDQIVANLVANAIDASSPAGEKQRTVTIKTSSTKRALTLHVQDRGIGIPDNEIKKIFEPFYTTKVSERGTGIGLYITKQAVKDCFHGTITAASSKRAGTVFTVELPLNER